MVYNYKYKMEWVGLKYAGYKSANPSADTIYYRLEFYKSEDIAQTYDVVNLDGAKSPFVLNYNAKSDYVFEPFRPSYGEINIKLGSNTSVVPEDFYNDIDNTTWKVVFKLINDTLVTETSIWSGYVSSSEIEYEWQDDYYLRLFVTDNLGILKEFNYSDSEQFSIPTNYDFYEGVSVKDFIIRCLNFIGLGIDYKFAMNFKESLVSVNETDMFLNEYAAIDWKRKYPRDVDTLLGGLLTSLGCICYLDNRDNTWTILNINELGTRTNNLVPYRKYNTSGTYLSSGNYDITTHIERNTDTIFSDANQIVTFRKPFSSVVMEYDFIPKNIIPNYGFFQFTGSTPDEWVGAGTIETGLKNPYDKFYLKYDINESKSGAFTGNIYEKMSVYMDRFLANYDPSTNTILGLTSNYAVNLTFDFLIMNGDTGDGFNISPIFLRPADSKALSFDKDGTWNTTTLSDLDGSNPVRIPVYSDDNSWNNFQVVSKYTASDGSSFTPSATNWFFELTEMRLYFRPLRVQSPSSGSPYMLIDNVQLNLVPTYLLPVNTYEFWAYKVGNRFFDNNTKKIKSIFNTGVFGQKDNAYVFEDIIFLKENYDGLNFIRSSNKWERSWENVVTSETRDSSLNCKTCSSVLSFYRASARRFTGNVYAEQTPISEVVSNPFGFPVYTSIKGTFNNSVNTSIYNAFETRVNTDGGLVETALCGADFLGEFNVIDSNFLSHKATFDYFTNKTLVTLEEDLTSTSEDWLNQSVIGSVSQSSNFGNVGSTTGNIQTTATDPA